MIKAVLFDLDGTLLPMDQDLFIKKYLMSISSVLSYRGYNPAELADNIMRGTYSMVKNNGEKTNEQRFWDYFRSVYGDRADTDQAYFEQFYIEHFDKLSKYCSPNTAASEAVFRAKQLGLRAILATNPVFPKIATHKRMAWAGLSPSDFELVTTYEVSHFCKPSVEYYTEILGKIGLSASECLMVGNDTRDDMSAEALGMQVFLLTDCLINPCDTDISKYANGNFSALKAYMEEKSK